MVVTINGIRGHSGGGCAELPVSCYLFLQSRSASTPKLCPSFLAPQPVPLTLRVPVVKLLHSLPPFCSQIATSYPFLQCDPPPASPPLSLIPCNTPGSWNNQLLYRGVQVHPFFAQYQRDSGLLLALPVTKSLCTAGLISSGSSPLGFRGTPAFSMLLLLRSQQPIPFHSLHTTGSSHFQTSHVLFFPLRKSPPAFLGILDNLALSKTFLG